MENNRLNKENKFVIYKTSKDVTRLVFIVDIEVVNRIERDDSRGLIIKVPEFIKNGEIIGESEAIKELLSNDVIILYGHRIIGVAIKLGLVNEESVLDINGLKHVQIFKFIY